MDSLLSHSPSHLLLHLDRKTVDIREDVRLHERCSTKCHSEDLTNSSKILEWKKIDVQRLENSKNESRFCDVNNDGM
ncbi:unnamed protein product [Cochlearia groenlandica]